MHLNGISGPPARKRRYFELGLLLLFCALTASAQCPSANHEDAAAQPVTKAETFRIGTAEVRIAPDWVGQQSMCQQPDVFWHDKDWNIDLVRPKSEDDQQIFLKIRSAAGVEKNLKLDDLFSQIASISLAPGNQAIVVAWVWGHMTGLFSVATIVDLASGQKTDQVVAASFSISPNRRFLIYENGDDQFYPLYDYRLYDLLKTPRENTCGYRPADRQHEYIDDEHRGFPLYPRKAGQITCSEPDLKAFGSVVHQPLSDFVWSADSSNVIFADAKNGKVLSVILVTTPVGPKDHPRTSIYVPNLSTSQWSNPPADGSHTIQLSWKGHAISLTADDPSPRIIQLSDFTRIP